MKRKSPSDNYIRIFPVHRQIHGRLHSIGDTVFIPDFGYNGTIVRFNETTVLVVPHDYGNVHLFFPSDLRPGAGISSFIRSWLTENGVYYNDPLKIQQGTVIHPSRPHFDNYSFD